MANELRRPADAANANGKKRVKPFKPDLAAAHRTEAGILCPFGFICYF
jgi:hypothetical protein